MKWHRTKIPQTRNSLPENGIYNKKYTNKHGLEKGGKPFSIGSLLSFLSNRHLLGIRIIRQKDGTVTEAKASWPGIIDEMTFARTQERLAKNKNRAKPEDWKTYSFPLTELVQCGECGKPRGGKSGTGQNGKHLYYGHPQIKNPFSRDHKPHACKVKNVLALRLEDLVTKSLQKLLDDPNLLNEWIEIYQRKAESDLPQVQSEQKRLDQEQLTTTKRISNLVQRVADLPPEIPADAFYEQIKQLNQKLGELKAAKENLKTKSLDLESQAIDKEGLKFKIRRTLANLADAPKDQQKPIFRNLVKFIEINPTKLKLGLYAPTQLKATGTDGQPTSGSQDFSNFSEIKSSSVTPSAPTPRGSSSTVGSGAPGRT